MEEGEFLNSDSSQNILTHYQTYMTPLNSISNEILMVSELHTITLPINLTGYYIQGSSILNCSNVQQNGCILNIDSGLYLSYEKDTIPTRYSEIAQNKNQILTRQSKQFPIISDSQYSMNLNLGKTRLSKMVPAVKYAKNGKNQGIYPEKNPRKGRYPGIHLLVGDKLLFYVRFTYTPLKLPLLEKYMSILDKEMELQREKYQQTLSSNEVYSKSLQKTPAIIMYNMHTKKITQGVSEEQVKIIGGLTNEASFGTITFDISFSLFCYHNQ